jgi:hypothetical protein
MMRFAAKTEIMKISDFWHWWKTHIPAINVRINTVHLDSTPWWDSNFFAGLTGTLVGGLLTYLVSMRLSRIEENKRKNESRSALEARTRALYSAISIEVRAIYCEAKKMRDDLDRIGSTAPRWLTRIGLCSGIHQYAEIVSPKVFHHVSQLTGNYYLLEIELADNFKMQNNSGISIGARRIKDLLREIMSSCDDILHLTGSVGRHSLPEKSLHP